MGSSSVESVTGGCETGMCRYGILSQHGRHLSRLSRQDGRSRDPQMWVGQQTSLEENLVADAGATGEQIKAIGISQMHGLVCVDKDQKVLHPISLWCDSRAVPYGEKAMTAR